MKNCLVLLIVLIEFVFVWPCQAQTQSIYIASPPEQAIMRAELDVTTGKMTELVAAAEQIVPGFLAVHPTLPILYALSVDKSLKKNEKGLDALVYAFEINRNTGELKKFGSISVNDSGSTHILVAPNGKYLVTCHYNGNGTSLVPLQHDGSFAAAISQIGHAGQSVHPKRQKRHHPHGVAISKDSRFVYVADLGTDRVEVFKVHENKSLARSSSWSAAAGAGPRHVTFHPDGNLLYCINELASTVSVLEVDLKSGELSHKQTVTTLPAEFKGQNSTAEVVLHSSGKFLYGSNRGHDSTAVFSIDPTSGKLTAIQTMATGGKHPRYIGLDLSGKIYLAANMNSNSILSFFVDINSGKLTSTGHQIDVAKPMSVAFFPIHEE